MFRANWQRRARVALVGLAIFLICAGASAQGRVQWKSRNLKESDGSWKIEVTIFMNRAPDIAHVPMRFSFKPVTYYERTLVDGRDDPVLRKVPLHNRQPIVESVDVGFLDPGSGKIQKRTRFSFKVTRAHGFEAGEYQVTIKNSRTNANLGGSQRIIFDGENEVINRRSMDFTKKKDDKKEEKEKKKEEEPASAPQELSPDDPAFWEGGPQEEDPQEEELPPPTSVRDKPGGCGCRTTDTAGAPMGAALGSLFLLGCLAVRRRL